MSGPQEIISINYEYYYNYYIPRKLMTCVFWGVGSGIPDSLQEWSSHCYSSRSQDPPAGSQPESFSLLCTCSLLPSGGPGWTLMKANCVRDSADDVFPREEWGFTGWQPPYLSLALDKTASGAMWQTWLEIIETTEALWVPRNSSLRPQEGPRERPPLPSPRLYFLSQGIMLWSPGPT